MTAWIDRIVRDARHSWRAIRRTPVVASVVVASMAIGIGVNTVVFSWIQARLVHPLPGVRSSAAMVLIEPRSDAGVYPGTSWPEYRDLRDRLQTIPDLIAYRMAPLYVGSAGQTERVFGQFVSDNYFTALGLTPVIGTFPTPATVSQAAEEDVAAISYGLWQSRFAGAADAIGRPLRINGRDVIVVGVTPREFQGTVLGLNFDVWVPALSAQALANGSREIEDRRIRGYSLIGRLAPSANRAQAQSEIDAAMAQLAAAYPETNATLKADVFTLAESPRGPQRLLTTALLVLQAMMLLLLFAVASNTATLMLARASARRREVGVRIALGAGPFRIGSLLAAESLILTTTGAILGAVLASWGTKALLVLPLTGFPIRFQTSVDAMGLAFAIMLGLITGVLVALAPAAQLARLDPLTVIRAGAQTAGRSRLRNGLIGVQMALATLVLIAAGLFLRSFFETRTIDPGFRREGVLLAAYDLNGRSNAESIAGAFPARVIDRIRELPGVDGAAIAAAVPLDIHGLPARSFAIEGRAPTGPNRDQALTNTVTPGYFGVMRIPFKAGVDFAPLTDAATAPQVIVNEAFVRRYLDADRPLTDALGRRIETRGRTYLVAGVVANSLSNAFGEPPTPVFYLSYRNGGQLQGEIHVRVKGGPPSAIAADVRRVVAELETDLPVFNVRSLDDHVDTNLLFRRIPARMFAVLGPMLLALVAIGIYAVVAYAVSLRTVEIGVRRALGATTPRLVVQCLGETATVIGIGALVGWTLALFGALLMGESALDVAVFAVAPLLLFGVSAVACWLPVRRAVRIDPWVALRPE